MQRNSCRLSRNGYPSLPLGSGIARLPVRYYVPILFTFDDQPTKNVTVADADVAAAYTRHELPVPDVPPVVAAQPSEREMQLLADVAAQPISTITKRYERLGWNYKTGNTVKDSVIEKKLATFDPVITPTGQVKILRLTERACDLLKQAGVSVARSRHCGAEHEYWKFVVAERLREQGFLVRAEHPVGGGRTVDLCAERGELRLLIEIETGRSGIAANAAKCVEEDAIVVFIFTSARVRAAHEAMIRATIPDAELLTTAEASVRRW